MFCKATYLYSIYTGALDNPRDVAKSFFEHAARLRPADVRENSKRLFVAYHDGPRFILYTLPLFYKKFITGNNARAEV